MQGRRRLHNKSMNAAVKTLAAYEIRLAAGGEQGMREINPAWRPEPIFY